MVTPAVVRLIVVLLALLAGSSIAPVVFAQETAVPAASPAVQQAVLAATPISGGRVFALPNGGGFPEGVVYDEATGDFYVGSTVDGTIYRGNIETGTVAVFLPGQPGRGAVGLALDDSGRLFVAGGDTGTVAVYDTATGQQLLEVANGLAPNTFLNDVDVSPTGDAYITDSYNPLLFAFRRRRSPPEGALRCRFPRRMLWRASSTSPRPASIWWSLGSMPMASWPLPTGGICLIVQTNTGTLYRVDTGTGETLQVDLGAGSLPGGDGLELDGQTLYVVREGQITRVELSPDYARGTVGASFSDPSFTDPTTLARFDGCLLVVNSQFSQQQGQSELPFTVSSVLIPAAAEAPGTPAAIPLAAGSC